MPAITPCVMPLPESPVAMKTRLAVRARVAADERDTVGRLDHLARPLADDLAGGAEALARPRLEPREALARVVVVAGLVVFAADDQQRRVFVAAGQPDVVVRVAGVPVAARAAAPSGGSSNAITNVRYAACFVWIATRSLTGVLVATTIAPAVTVVPARGHDPRRPAPPRSRPRACR